MCNKKTKHHYPKKKKGTTNPIVIMSRVSKLKRII